MSFDCANFQFISDENQISERWTMEIVFRKMSIFWFVISVRNYKTLHSTLGISFSEYRIFLQLFERKKKKSFPFILAFFLFGVNYKTLNERRSKLCLCLFKKNVLIRFDNFLIVAQPSQVKHETVYANRLLLQLLFYLKSVPTFQQWIANICVLQLQSTLSKIEVE